jgi:protein-tyrosine phosphatase
MSGDPFRVVFICTGNRFRSPLAEAFFRVEAGAVPVDVRSLGTLELGDAEALPEAVELARQYGVDLTAHRASGLRGIDLSGVDLVVGFERRHMAAAVVEARASIERTFTLPELVGFLTRQPAPGEPDPQARARAAVRLAHTRRPPDFRRAPVAELADPLGLSPAAQHEVALEVRRLTSALAAELFGS